MLRRALNWLLYPSKAAVSDAESISAHASELSARCARLETTVAELSLSWAETLDKLQAWSNRQNARDAKRVKASLDTLNSSQEAVGAPISHQSLQDPTVSKEELRRAVRARNGGMP